VKKKELQLVISGEAGQIGGEEGGKQEKRQIATASDGKGQKRMAATVKKLSLPLGEKRGVASGLAGGHWGVKEVPPPSETLCSA